MTTHDPDRRLHLPARVRAWAWYGALGMLLVLTSLAVASVKVWLVLPYLALMALILFTPPGQREREVDHDKGSESEAGSGPGAESAEGRTGAEVDDASVADASADPATVTELLVEPAEVPDPDPDPRGVKTRRGKGRGRKAKAVVESPGVSATWVQVGPGKFVRAESAAPPVAATSPSSEGEPSGSLPPSSGSVEDRGPATDAQPPSGRDAEAPPGVEESFNPGGESEERSVPAPDETAGDASGLLHGEGNLERAPGPDVAAGSAAAVDGALESHFEPPLFEGEPIDSWASSSGTTLEMAAANVPVDASEAALAAGGSSSTEGGSETWAEAVSHEIAAFAPVPMHAEGNLEPAPGPDLAARSAAAIDAAFAAPPDVPPSAGDPDDFFASLAGIGEKSTGTRSPGDEAETEAVPTAEDSFAPGEDADVGDTAGPGDPTAEESAAAQAGGDPEHAWQSGLPDESSRDAVLGSYPDAPPSADAEYDAGVGESESESENAAERARDARDQALEEIVGGVVAGEIADAALELDASLESDPDGDGARDNGNAPDAFSLNAPALQSDPDGDGAGDNGIAPDAFHLIAPAEIEDASDPDPAEVAAAPAAPSDRPDRPTVGPFLASLRGLRSRVGPATVMRSRPDATSPRRVVRSVRRVRVSPILRTPSRRGPGRSRPASRTFPPRSPPVVSGRS